MHGWSDYDITHPEVIPDYSALIETVIDEDLAKLIYNAAKKKGWKDEFDLEILGFGGGEEGISVDGLLTAVPEEEVAKVRGIGKKRAAVIYEQLQHSLSLEPGY